jgi:hypothetical protein
MNQRIKPTIIASTRNPAAKKNLVTGVVHNDDKDEDEVDDGVEDGDESLLL